MQLDVTLQPGSLLQPRAALKPHQMLPLLSLCLVFLLLSSFNESLKAEGFQALSPFQEPLSDLPETLLSSESAQGDFTALQRNRGAQETLSLQGFNPCPWQGAEVVFAAVPFLCLRSGQSGILGVHLCSIQTLSGKREESVSRGCNPRGAFNSRAAEESGSCIAVSSSVRSPSLK